MSIYFLIQKVHFPSITSYLKAVKAFRSFSDGCVTANYPLRDCLLS